MMNHRIGFGLDFHKLQDNIEFWLGGIKIPHNKGALGHSDADVLIHAICDALLGAANLGDIGMHFPDSDEEYRNIDSKILLRKVNDLLKGNNFFINNIDSTIVLETPKIGAFIPKMKDVLAEILLLSPSQISIKATTSEGLGFTGRQEGISAYAIVMLIEEAHNR